MSKTFLNRQQFLQIVYQNSNRQAKEQTREDRR